jgi:hypothetical protein
MINIFDKPQSVTIEEKFFIAVFTILIITTLNASLSIYSSVFLMGIFALIKNKIIKWKT